MTFRLAPALAALLLLSAVPLARGAAAQTPKTEEEKTLYALGLAVAQNLRVFDLSPTEVKMVTAGLVAGLSNEKPAVDLAAYQDKLDPLAQARTAGRAAKERGAAAGFLAAAEKEKGARKLPSGLIYRETKAGSGESPGPNDEVKVHYTGKLRTGKVFDSSLERGQPADFPLPRMVPCWREGLVLMKPGGKAVITCPADLAYGDTGVPPGAGDRIPPGAALEFEVELISVKKGAGVAPDASPVAPPKSN